MYVYLLRTLSIQISKTKLLVKMASESGREEVKIPGPSVLDAWDYFSPLRVGK